MTSLSKILRGEVEPKTSYIKEFLAHLTHFFGFFSKGDNLTVGLVSISKKYGVKNYD